MGDSGSVLPPIATSNPDLNDVPADLFSRMNNFFTKNFIGSFILSMVANVCSTVVMSVVVFLWKRAARSKRDSELLEMKDKLGQFLNNQANFCSRQTTSTANRDSATNAADVRALPLDTRSVAPTPSQVEPPAASSELNGASKRFHRTRNGFITDNSTRSETSERCASSSSHGTSPSEGVKESTVIDVAPVLMVLSSPEGHRANINEVIKDVEKNHDLSIEHDVSSSRILQAKMKLTEESLSALRNIAVKFMKVDKGFTLQFGGCFLYYCDGNPEEPIRLNLREVEVPTVLQADYIAGVLTIRGAYLKGAEFRATTSDGHMILKSITQDKSNNNTSAEEGAIEVWKCTDPLPPYKLDEVKIFATRRVTIQGHDVTVRSKVTPIVNIFWRTVFRNWLPTAILTVFWISQAWGVMASLCNVVENHIHRFWLLQLLPASAIFVIQLVPARFEDSVKDFMERFKLAISSFHVLPNLLGSPAFFMRNGLCYQSGAKYLVDSKFAIGGPDKQADPKETGQAGSDHHAAPSLENDNEGGDCSGDDENRPDVTSPDWKWSCWRYEGEDANMVKFDPESNLDAQPTFSNPSQTSDPFSVIYLKHSPRYHDKLSRFKQELFSGKNGRARVRLYSKYLLLVIKKLLPARLKASGEISARHLLARFIFCKDLNQSHLDAAETDESDRLHMRHLIRFLENEYTDIIAQYERMDGAGVISFSMLWTLMVPGVEVVYPCVITKEDLCGKVVSAEYYLDSSKEKVKLKVTVEAYDYDCVDFGAKTAEIKIYHFIGEQKIMYLKMYPLRRKENPIEAADFFLERGMKFCELVVKHERRFMQYQGLIYESAYNKESVHGRVMIDQGAFAKMKPNREMGTAEPSKNVWTGDRPRMDQDEIDKIKPLLKYAPAKVYGYSFSSRSWGCFTVQGFSEIKFESTAFDKSLIMKKETKKTVLTLSEHYIKGMENEAIGNPDPLPHKGKGCIILLYGPPGTGKTLTVETLAEKYECPLWQLSISNLSAVSKKLEMKLLKTFEIAESWRAILLLDEADVYLSSRKYSPLSSNAAPTNAMTGFFLRLLEHYKGLLFLTTNMVDIFDEAIYSRMSLFVEFKEFDDEERKNLWTGSLHRAGFKEKSLSPEFWKEVLPVKFNGRVIRNVVQNAQILAQGEKKPLSESYLLEAFEVMATPSVRKHLIRCIEEGDDKPTSQADFTSQPPPSEATAPSDLPLNTDL